MAEQATTAPTCTPSPANYDSAGHRATTSVTAEKAHTIHTRISIAARPWAFPEDFYWFTLDAAPADSVHYMTEAELPEFGFGG